MMPDLGPAIRVLTIFAVIGLIALLVGVPWGVWWLVTHVTIGVV